MLSHASHAVNDIYWFVIPAVLPVILDEFKLGYGWAGGILTAFLLTIAVFSLIFGHFSDRFSRWAIISLGFILASLGFFLSGFSHTEGTLIATLLIAAVGVSTYHPSMYAAVDENAKIKRGKIYGFFEFWGVVGILGVFFLFGSLLQRVDWRGIFFLTAIPGVWLAFLFIRNPVPKQDNSKLSDTTQSKKTVPGFSLKIISLFFIGLSLRILSITAIVNFAPTYLVREFNLPVDIANYGTGLIFLGGMIFALTFGILSDRYNQLAILLFLSGMIAPIIFFLGITHQLFLVYMLLFLLGGFWLGFSPVQNIYVSTLTSSIGKGMGFGFLMGFMTLTNAFGPGLFGVLADFTNLRTAILWYTLPALFGWVLLLIMARSMKKTVVNY
jgi:MFS family permease